MGYCRFCQTEHTSASCFHPGNPTACVNCATLEARLEEREQECRERYQENVNLRKVDQKHQELEERLQQENERLKAAKHHEYCDTLDKMIAGKPCNCYLLLHEKNLDLQRRLDELREERDAIAKTKACPDHEKFRCGCEPGVPPSSRPGPPMESDCYEGSPLQEIDNLKRSEARLRVQFRCTKLPGGPGNEAEFIELETWEGEGLGPSSGWRWLQDGDTYLLTSKPEALAAGEEQPETFPDGAPANDAAVKAEAAGEDNG